MKPEKVTSSENRSLAAVEKNSAAKRSRPRAESFATKLAVEKTLAREERRQVGPQIEETEYRGNGSWRHAGTYSTLTCELKKTKAGERQQKSMTSKLEQRTA
jgi:hypothetical protein